jgi:Protein of unknown function (DUF3147)
MNREADDAEPLVAADPGNLREIKPRDLAVRFAFGAATSVIAGGATLLYGPHAGGVFLAFPAILTASVTLIEKDEGMAAAVHDVEGAVLGAVGLALFAIAFEATIERAAVGWALVLSMATWLATSVALYLTVEIARRVRRKGLPPRRRTG